MKKVVYNLNTIEGSMLTERESTSIFNTRTIFADNEYIEIKELEETYAIL